MTTNYQEALEKGWAVPVAKDTFSFDSDGQAHLLASKCAHCDATIFPSVARCPSCFKAEMQPAPLATGGELHSFTVVRQGPPEWKGEVPYIIASVTTDDGVEIMTQLGDCAPEDAALGMKVTINVRPMYKDDEDREVLGPVFVPANN